ncbi:MAG: phosphotransferase family protein [Olsenella sp.]|nr:phosphotransferase family protein [Olsenella sp.]
MPETVPTTGLTDIDTLGNICATLGCAPDDVTEFSPIEEGLTNDSFRFVAKGKAYVYRKPGAGTEKIISREGEAFAQGVAAKLGLDRTFIYEDPKRGWKISHFVDGCVPFDYHNEKHVRRAMEMARQLHSCGVTSTWSFDVFENTRGILELLSDEERGRYEDFNQIRALIDGLEERVRATSGAPVLCHNDFYDPNFLVRGEEISLIDWEYSGMSDYASDLGTFICCSDYSYDEALDVLREYFQREPSAGELFHCVSYVAFAAWYWFVWALYKDQCGDPVGDWQDLWHRYASEYGRRAEQLASEA